MGGSPCHWQVSNHLILSPYLGLLVTLLCALQGQDTLAFILSWYPGVVEQGVQVETGSASNEELDHLLLPLR